MKFSILINCHNQENYIHDCITSCFNQEYSNFEVIVIDSSDRKLDLSNLNYKKNLKYLHIKKFYEFPELNQMYKIELGLKEASGDYICLLDGDDFFKNNKLKNLSEFIKQKKTIINQDLPVLIEGNNEYTLKIKKIKESLFFKKFIVSWPQIYGTSSITVKKNILKEFFSKSQPYNWKLLAIDVQLILFCQAFYNITNELKNITYKRKHGQNLGDLYLDIFSKIFWKRRMCQHNFYNFLKNKRILNLDYVLTRTVNFFL